ncbi:AtpZ/AtpI family protein [Megalodesulfovibrio paquesii]
MAEQDARSRSAAGAEKAPSESPAKGSGLMQAVSGVSSNAGLLGLHMVSSTAVGLAMGWFLDKWLGTKPWLMIVFLGMGIVEGFRNMWKEAQRIRRHEDAVQVARESGEAPPEAPGERKLVFFKKAHFVNTYASPTRTTADVADTAGEHRNADAPVVEEKTHPAGEKNDEVLDEEALRQALIRELEEAKGDPEVAQALRTLLRQAEEDANSANKLTMQTMADVLNAAASEGADKGGQAASAADGKGAGAAGPRKAKPDEES